MLLHSIWLIKPFPDVQTAGGDYFHFWPTDHCHLTHWLPLYIFDTEGDFLDLRPSRHLNSYMQYLDFFLSQHLARSYKVVVGRPVSGLTELKFFQGGKNPTTSTFIPSLVKNFPPSFWNPLHHLDPRCNVFKGSVWAEEEGGPIFAAGTTTTQVLVPQNIIIGVIIIIIICSIIFCTIIIIIISNQ